MTGTVMAQWDDPPVRRARGAARSSRRVRSLEAGWALADSFFVGAILDLSGTRRNSACAPGRASQHFLDGGSGCGRLRDGRCQRILDCPETLPLCALELRRRLRRGGRVLTLRTETRGGKGSIGASPKLQHDTN